VKEEGNEEKATARGYTRFKRSRRSTIGIEIKPRVSILYINNNNNDNNTGNNDKIMI
jgi:hypothetical protein